MTTFLFLRVTHDPAGFTRRAVTRGEPRISSVRSWPRCRFLLVTQVCPTAISGPPRHLAHVNDLRRHTRSECRLTCTGLWTERRTCPRAWRRFLGVSRDECVRLAHADDVPLLILPEDTCCRRCDRLHGNEPHTVESDRPRPTLLRQPAKAIGILWTRVPSTVAAGVRERIAPLRFPCRPPAHAAHTLPPWLGTKCLLGIASIAVGGEPGRQLRESRSPFQPVGTLSRFLRIAPGPDDPSTPTGSVCVAFRES